MNAAHDSKSAVRATARAALAAIQPPDRAAVAVAIAEHAEHELAGVAAGQGVLLFAPLPSEPDLLALADRLVARGVRVALPRVRWSEGEMVPAEFRGPACLVDLGRGVRGPGPDCPEVPTRTLRAVVVPGLAFDRACGRLGRGGGFYDRFLAPLGEGVQRIGVAFGVQLVERVPIEPHDARMHVVMTEAGVAARCGGKRFGSRD